MNDLVGRYECREVPPSNLISTVRCVSRKRGRAKEEAELPGVEMKEF